MEQRIFQGQTPDNRNRHHRQIDMSHATWEFRSEFKGNDHLANDKGMEEARRGQLPAFHLLASSDIQGFEREVRVVDFRRVYSLPVEFVRARAGQGKRLRLLPPYPELASQEKSELEILRDGPAFHLFTKIRRDLLRPVKYTAKDADETILMDVCCY